MQSSLKKKKLKPVDFHSENNGVYIFLKEGALGI